MQIMANGEVRWGGEDFDSPSTAAGAARASVIGRGPGGEYPHTIGWTFWKYQDADGEFVGLDHLRKEYLKRQKGVG